MVHDLSCGNCQSTEMFVVYFPHIIHGEHNKGRYRQIKHSKLTVNLGRPEYTKTLLNKKSSQYIPMANKNAELFINYKKSQKDLVCSLQKR